MGTRLPTHHDQGKSVADAKKEYIIEVEKIIKEFKSDSSDEEEYYDEDDEYLGSDEEAYDEDDSGTDAVSTADEGAESEVDEGGGSRKKAKKGK